MSYFCFIEQGIEARIIKKIWKGFSFIIVDTQVHLRMWLFCQISFFRHLKSEETRRCVTLKYANQVLFIIVHYNIMVTGVTIMWFLRWIWNKLIEHICMSTLTPDQYSYRFEQYASWKNYKLCRVSSHFHRYFNSDKWLKHKNFQGKKKKDICHDLRNKEQGSNPECKTTLIDSYTANTPTDKIGEYAGAGIKPTTFWIMCRCLKRHTLRFHIEGTLKNFKIWIFCIYL